MCGAYYKGSGRPDARLLCTLLLACLVFLGADSVLRAQIGGKAYEILDIEVEGNVIADRATIVAVSGLRKGDKIVINNNSALQNETIQEAIRNLWARKQFEDIQIIPDKITPLGIFLKIVVKEYPRLNEVVVRGNDDLSAEDIRKAVGKYRGEILSPYDAYVARKVVKDLYVEEGMPFSKVFTSIEPTDTANYYKLIIEVEEGSDYYIESISFSGNEHFSDDDLESALDDINTKSWWQFWRSDAFDLEEYATAKENLIRFYRKNGFLDTEILKDSVAYDDDLGAVYIMFELYEGTPLYIRNIEFKGNLVYPSELLLKRLDFQTGDVYDVERFQQNLTANENQTDVASLYLDNGYLRSQFPFSEKRIGKDSVDVTVNVFENERFTIRRVEIQGNTKTHDKVIRRELYTRPGDYFSRSAIIRSIRSLGVLNYFNPEALKPDFRQVDNTHVDVIYEVEERSSDTFNASVGFAGSFGVTGSIGITLNNFSISEPLVGGAGQQFRFEWQFGGSNSLQTFTLGFTEPWLFNEPTTIGFNLFDTRQRVGYDLRQTGVSVNVGRRFRWPDDFFRGDWILRWRRNDVRGENTGFKTGVSTEVSVRQTFSRINLDNIIFPSAGSRFSFTTQFAFGALGVGTTDYLKNELNFELYNPLWQTGGMNRLVLHLNSTLGYIAGLQSDTTIPPIEYYFMGGNGLSGFSVTPLRGYEDREIGPQDAVGNNIGGRFMIKHVAELRFALSLNPIPIYILGFAEAGNVWSGIQDSDPFDLKRSAGVGMRMLLNPIGLLGFDYGFGFDPLRSTGEKSGWHFHFQFGR